MSSELTVLYALRRFYEGIKHDSTFQSFESFCNWAAGKYKPGYTVYKLDQAKPHSKENSYWYFATKKPEEILRPICVGCDLNMAICNTIGCLKYREQFVKNWNERIHWSRQEPKKQEPKMKEFFRYEHPDLVGEGSVFENRPD